MLLYMKRSFPEDAAEVPQLHSQPQIDLIPVSFPEKFKPLHISRRIQAEFSSREIHIHMICNTHGTHSQGNCFLNLPLGRSIAVCGKSSVQMAVRNHRIVPPPAT